MINLYVYQEKSYEALHPHLQALNLYIHKLKSSIILPHFSKKLKA